jgi:GNAT superfamily N-acetyltransferase
MSRAVISAYDPSREESWVHDTWARSYQRADGVKQIDPSLYYRWHRQLREQILSRSQCLVLRDSEQPDYLYGYIVAEPSAYRSTLVVHWAYVRSRDRGERYGYQLLRAALELAPEATRLLYTHRTYFHEKAEELGFRHIGFKELSYETK